MIDQLLQKIPKLLLAIICISAVIAFLLLNNPPYTLCDAQINHFKDQQKGKLFKDPSDKVFKNNPAIPRLLTICKESVAPGACYEYFAIMRGLLRDFKLVSQECVAKHLVAIPEVKNNLLNGTQLMVQLAWREEVLRGTVDKFNWLSPSDLSLFCKMKRKITLFYGPQYFKNFEKSMLDNLPSAKAVSPKTLKNNSILSENCSKYP